MDQATTNPYRSSDLTVESGTTRGQATEEGKRCWVPRPVIAALFASVLILIVLNAVLYTSPQLSEMLLQIIPDAIFPFERGCEGPR